MRKILASAAAIALSATMVHAEPGKGKGYGGGGDNAAAQVKGGGPDKRDRGPAVKADRGPSMKGNERRMAQAERGPPAKAERSQPAKADRGSNAKFDRGAAQKIDKAEHRVESAQAGRNVQRQAETRGNDRVYRERRDDDVLRITRTEWIGSDRNRGLIEGCPPGLAKKNNGCMPPGLARDRQGSRDFREAYYQPDWWGLERFQGRAYYDDGYLYRLGSDNSVLGFIPLLGGALSVGNPWPSYYDPMPVPQYYADYYNLGPSGSYRYADDVLYRVDPETSAITAIAALLTGDDFAVGQQMPMGYDVYNVPYDYRDRYYDTPDSMYRYSDGYVYQIDPKTRLVAAAIELLV